MRSYKFIFASSPLQPQKGTKSTKSFLMVSRPLTSFIFSVYVLFVPLCGSCSFVIKLRLRWLAVVGQRAFLADRVRALEDPVLPGGQAAINLCVHRFRTSETKRCFHAGQRIGRQRGAFFNRHADLVFPVEFVRRERD